MSKRTIKFRAWDKEDKKFFEPTYKAYEGNLEYLVIGMNGRLGMKGIETIRDESLFPDRFELMQFTGLKDKNGKDIYEGDIVRYDGFRKNLIGIVTFEDSAFGLKSNSHEHEGSFHYGIEEYCWENFKVIGNIYENPKLLANN